jgi:hypothetical protein
MRLYVENGVSPKNFVEKNRNNHPGCRAGIYNPLARKILSFSKELENPIGAIRYFLLDATMGI